MLLAEADQPISVEAAASGESPLDPELALSYLTLLERFDRDLSYGAHVTVLRWPEDGETASVLAGLGLPRLLLVGEGPAPTDRDDELEDWVRLPVSDVDVCTRLRRLRDRAEGRPTLDGAGRLLFQSRWVPLSPIEERIASRLVRFFGRVVPNQDLAAAGWADGMPTENGRRLMMRRLRDRCRELGLDLTAIRCRGYVLNTVGAGIV